MAKKKKSAPKKKSTSKKKTGVTIVDKDAKTTESKQQTYKTLKVNFWRTRLHAEELGVYQSLKYMAKTRYFAKNFDIEGIVEEDDKKKYIIAYNKDQWEEEPNEKKRLICRIFTIMEEGMGVEKGGNYKGGFELSVTHSLIQSSEMKEAAPVFFTQLPGMTYLTKIVKGRRLTGTRWTFPLLPEKKEDKLQMVTAKGAIGMGIDYDIKIGKKIIAKLDGQRVQKQWEIEIYDEAYAKDKTFIILLIMFGMICNFMKSTTKLVDKFFKPMRDTGTSDFKPAKHEMDLFKNPRMMRK